jgi:hypothetical protein
MDRVEKEEGLRQGDRSRCRSHGAGRQRPAAAYAICAPRCGRDERNRARHRATAACRRCLQDPLRNCLASRRPPFPPGRQAQRPIRGHGSCGASAGAKPRQINRAQHLPHVRCCSADTGAAGRLARRKLGANTSTWWWRATRAQAAPARSLRISQQLDAMSERRAVHHCEVEPFTAATRSASTSSPVAYRCELEQRIRRAPPRPRTDPSPCPGVPGDPLLSSWCPSPDAA